MTAIRIAAVFGFLAVLLGALGAHKLEEPLTQLGTLSRWHTATLYHLVHAAVLLAVAFVLAAPGATPSRAAWVTFWLFVAGVVLFSGSLYLYAFTGIRKIAIVTPFGGLCLLAGWLMLAIRGLK